MSGFSELIKNFEKTRSYLRDFFIYGYKVRGDFQRKSGRTYDDEKRHLGESSVPAPLTAAEYRKIRCTRHIIQRALQTMIYGCILCSLIFSAMKKDFL